MTMTHATLIGLALIFGGIFFLWAVWLITRLIAHIEVRIRTEPRNADIQRGQLHSVAGVSADRA